MLPLADRNSISIPNLAGFNHWGDMAQSEADVKDLGQVTLKFTTKLPAQYRVPETPVVRYNLPFIGY